MPADQAFTFIDSNELLAKHCADWSRCDALAVDTEFMRTSTFYAKLGLLQVGDGVSAYLIDPLQIDDWKPWRTLCENSGVEFIFHSCSEDLSVFLSHFGFLPTVLFDTQLAAAFVQLGGSLSYAALVSEVLNIEVDKGATRSDWLQRPLSDSQLHYAAVDVIHLHSVRAYLIEKLEQRSALAWLRADCTQLIETAKSVESPQSWSASYLGISNAWRLPAAALPTLQALAAWREREARRRDKPRNWVAKEADLAELALVIASDAGRRTLGALASGGLLSKVDPQFLKRNLNQLEPIIDAVGHGPAVSDTANDTQGFHSPLESPPLPLSKERRGQLKLLQHAVDSCAQRLGIGPEVIARKRQLLAFLDINANSAPQTLWPTELAGWKQEQLESEFKRALAHA